MEVRIDTMVKTISLGDDWDSIVISGSAIEYLIVFSVTWYIQWEDDG